MSFIFKLFALNAYSLKEELKITGIQSFEFPVMTRNGLLQKRQCDI